MISVITVCKNDRQGLERTYKSLGPLGDAVEWIVVDGASTDGAREFLESLPGDRIRYVSEPDRGIYHAMNKGLRMGCGRHCIFMNAGDEFATPGTLSQIARALKPDTCLLYGDAIEASARGETYKKAHPAWAFRYSMFTHHQAIVYRSADLGAGYDLSFRLAADWAKTSQLMMRGVAAEYFPAAICRFRRGGASDNGDLRPTANRELWRIYREVHGRAILPALLLTLVKRALNALRLHTPFLYGLIRMSKPKPYRPPATRWS